MEEEVYKTREDFETESEWYTYCIENGLAPFSGEPEKMKMKKMKNMMNMEYLYALIVDI